MNDYEKICGKEIVQKLEFSNKLNRHWDKIFLFNLVILFMGVIIGAVLNLISLVWISCLVSLLLTAIGCFVASYACNKAEEVCDDIRGVTRKLDYATAVSILQGTHIEYAFGSSKLLRLG